MLIQKDVVDFEHHWLSIHVLQYEEGYLDCDIHLYG